MKLLLFFLSLIVLVTPACEESANDGPIIEMRLEDEDNFFKQENVISQFEAIPLSTPENVILSNDNILKYNKDIMILIDRLHSGKVHIFNRDGSYRASISAKGRGPNEYLDMASCQLFNDCIVIYSYHKKGVLFYDYDANFITKKGLSFTPYNLYCIEDGYWGYMGFGNGQISERVVKLNQDGDIVTKILPTDANILPMTEVEDVFIPSDMGIIVRESFVNGLSLISNDIGSSFVKFDFGDYSIPSKYYNYSSPMKAAEELFKSDFATINQVLANNDILVVNIECHKQSELDDEFDVLLFLKNNNWTAIKVDKNNELLYRSVKGITPNNELILLLNEDTVENYSHLFKGMDIKNVKNNNVEYFIVLCKLDL